jgi:flagellar hook-associated protein 2
MGTVSGTGSNLDQMVQYYRASLNKPVQRLQTQQSTLNSQLTIYATLKTKLQTLSTTAKALGTMGTASPFLAYAVDISDSTVAAATSTSAAIAGSHTLHVSQLASNDSLLSAGVTATAASGLTASSPYTFSVSLADGTSKSVTITTGTSTTNADVLASVAAGINGDTTLNQKLSASVVKIDATTSRLVITSKTSGSSNAITSFSGDLNSVLGFSGVDFTGRTSSTATNAGFMKGGSATTALNAQFSLDGIAMNRESNTVSDALTGTTLTLKSTQKVTDNDITLKISPDQAAVKKQVQQIITDYNDALSYMNTNMSTDAKTGKRGALLGDSTLIALRASLRNVVSAAVSGTVSGYPNSISAIGITVADDGTMSLSDESTFNDAVSSDVHKVADLFINSSGSGIATNIKTMLDSVVSTAGSIATSTTSINNQLKYISDKITSLNTQYDKKAEDYRTKMAQIQVMLTQASQQQSLVSSLIG